MVLVVDDKQERVDAYKQNWADSLLTCVATVAETLVLMQHFKFDILFLDYNLGIKGAAIGGKLSGAEVARWLADPVNELSVPELVVISTHSLDGRYILAQLLPHALCCPLNAWDYTPKELSDHLIPACEVQPFIPAHYRVKP